LASEFLAPVLEAHRDVMCFEGGKVGRDRLFREGEELFPSRRNEKWKEGGMIMVDSFIHIWDSGIGGPD
jgi:hypothetical protein